MHVVEGTGVRIDGFGVRSGVERAPVETTASGGGRGSESTEPSEPGGCGGGAEAGR